MSEPTTKRRRPNDHEHPILPPVNSHPPSESLSATQRSEVRSLQHLPNELLFAIVDSLVPGVVLERDGRSTIPIALEASHPATKMALALALTSQRLSGFAMTYLYKRCLYIDDFDRLVKLTRTLGGYQPKLRRGFPASVPLPVSDTVGVKTRHSDCTTNTADLIATPLRRPVSDNLPREARHRDGTVRSSELLAKKLITKTKNTTKKANLLTEINSLYLSPWDKYDIIRRREINLVAKLFNLISPTLQRLVLNNVNHFHPSCGVSLDLIDDLWAVLSLLKKLQIFCCVTIPLDSLDSRHEAFGDEEIEYVDIRVEMAWSEIRIIALANPSVEDENNIGVWYGMKKLERLILSGYDQPGLANMKGIWRSLESAWSHRRKADMVYVDIKRLKDVNWAHQEEWESSDGLRYIWCEVPCDENERRAHEREEGASQPPSREELGRLRAAMSQRKLRCANWILQSIMAGKETIDGEFLVPDQE